MRRLTRRSALQILGATAAGGVLSGRALAARETESGSFTTEHYGFRTYERYVPSGYDGSPVPLVVMLHGCGQTPSTFAAATRMNALAEREDFLVIYPDQTTLANPTQCWEWFEPENQRRGAGEPAAIAGMTREVRSNFAIDDSAVYLAGFSAGGAMAPIMAAAYPEIYAAVGVHSGLEYDAANSALGAPAAMSFGGPDPQEQGEEAYEEMGERAGVVRTVVFHGEDDYTIDPINGDQATAQAIRTNDLATDSTDEEFDTVPETVRRERSSGHRYTVREFAGGDGDVLVAKYAIEGMGHTWAGGAPGSFYTEPDAPDASRLVWDFFVGGSED
ncbi:esterase [Halobacteriales archaeon QH_8_64_26]|nr:MAG: esterase [Halobacteriales archaeon QH_8_64_26]